ncbi:MAG: alpha/beta hydrolase [Pyrinomonadaceae bacterium]|nr:alpha/beta hydrolase [Pyrinomonadaceae bacterium]MCX7640979.1 alpha/beta hydrolase [Pyrinomonadaceae bacterium]MDW8305097.1 alpha/beta fold hydrolase [Acidobacteriota bacterium]
MNRLAFKQYGNGHPVVLLHAFPLDNQMWQPQIELASEKLCLILPDLPGFGETELSPEEISIESIAYEVLELLKHLNIKKASIGGLSMGGYVTFNLYRIAPELFHSILLFDTSPFADTDEKRNARIELIKQIKTKGVLALVENMLPNLISENTKQKNPVLVSWLKEKFLQTKVTTIEKTLLALANRKDHSYLLKEIKVPTLLIFGEHDSVTNLEIANKLYHLIPNSKLFKIPEAGHYSNLENPIAFNSALKEFLYENYPG